MITPFSTGCLSFGWYLLLDFGITAGILMAPLPDKITKAKAPLAALVNFCLFWWWIVSLFRC